MYVQSQFSGFLLAIHWYRLISPKVERAHLFRVHLMVIAIRNNAPSSSHMLDEQLTSSRGIPMVVVPIGLMRVVPFEVATPVRQRLGGTLVTFFFHFSPFPHPDRSIFPQRVSPSQGLACSPFLQSAVACDLLARCWYFDRAEVGT